MATIEGMDALFHRLNAIGDTHAMLRTVQTAAIEEAQARAPRRTGFLQRSIVPGPVTRDYAIVRATAPYAPPVEFGSRPHIIKPRNAKVLAWGGPRRLTGRLKKGGEATHFARVVHHPGTKPHPFLVPGAEKAIGLFKELVVTLWNKAG